MSDNAPANPTAPAAGSFEGHVIAPDVDNSEQPTTPEGPQTVSLEQFQALEKRLEEATTQATERERGLTQQIQTLMMRPQAAPQGPAAPAAPATLSLDDLPDPVQNPKEYNAALSKRVGEYIAQSSQSSQQQLLGQMANANTLNTLYQRLATEHPDLAKRQILLQGAAAAEFQNLQAQGINPLAAAQQNPDSLIGGIVRRMQAELGIDPNAPAAPGPAAPGAAPTGPAGPSAPSSARTDGLGGGSAPTVPNGPAQRKPKSFSEQLKSTQMADGLI